VQYYNNDDCFSVLVRKKREIMAKKKATLTVSGNNIETTHTKRKERKRFSIKKTT
jgi:hypothetical protein